jgi:hypothetical protein
LERERAMTDSVAQIQLMLSYRALVRSGAPLPSLAEVGFKVNSQTDEDGILLYLFALLGVGQKTAIELCAGSGEECNTANLILNHGWCALLVDGNEALVSRGREYFSKHPNTFVHPPQFTHAWVTRDSVNDLIRANGFQGEVDLLSLDLDGVDYWIWKSIDVVQPRVVVLEYQDILGPERSVTVPYSDDFDYRRYPTTRGMPNYCGASLSAFVKLGRAKGYRFVGCNRLGYNAFFVKDELARDLIPEASVESCFRHPKVRWGMSERFPSVRDFPWIEV